MPTLFHFCLLSAVVLRALVLCLPSCPALYTFWIGLASGASHVWRLPIQGSDRTPVFVGFPALRWRPLLAFGDVWEARDPGTGQPLLSAPSPAFWGEKKGTCPQWCSVTGAGVRLAPGAKLRWVPNFPGLSLSPAGWPMGGRPRVTWWHCLEGNEGCEAARRGEPKSRARPDRQKGSRATPWSGPWPWQLSWLQHRELVLPHSGPQPLPVSALDGLIGRGRRAACLMSLSIPLVGPLLKAGLFLPPLPSLKKATECSSWSPMSLAPGTSNPRYATAFPNPLGSVTCFHLWALGVEPVGRAGVLKGAFTTLLVQLHLEQQQHLTLVPPMAHHSPAWARPSFSLHFPACRSCSLHFRSKAWDGRLPFSCVIPKALRYPPALELAQLGALYHMSHWGRVKACEDEEPSWLGPSLPP